MGTVGPLARLADTVFSWLTSESGRAEVRQRRSLKAKKEDARAALAANDFIRLRLIVDELRRIANRP